jgi:MFS family permease
MAGLLLQLHGSGRAGGQIVAAAVFLPLASYMAPDAFNSWGWRIPFLLSVVIIIAAWFTRKEVEETPAFVEEGQHGEIPKAPIVEALTTGWADILRVILMAWMSVIPAVATIFGAAYATQPAYEIGSPRAFISGLRWWETS